MLRITQPTNMTRLESISKNHLLSTKTLGIEMEKPPATRTLQLCIDQLANTRTQENISRNHLPSENKLVTEEEKPSVMQSLETFINQ